MNDFDEVVRRAKSGSTAAAILLGSSYLSGSAIGERPVAQNFAEARRWLLRAHEQGAHSASYLLATMYESGLGVGVDVRKAISIYEGAAEAGGYLPCIALARIYAHGREVPVSIAQARYWYQRALAFQDEVDGDEIEEARAFLRQEQKS